MYVSHVVTLEKNPAPGYQNRRWTVIGVTLGIDDHRKTSALPIEKNSVKSDTLRKPNKKTNAFI